MLYESLALYKHFFLTLNSYTLALEEWVSNTSDCQKLLKIEGIGLLNAIYLYINIVSEEFGEFKSGRDLFACIGLTSVQHSSGGQVNLGTLCKRKKTSLRSLLIRGSMSVV